MAKKDNYNKTLKIGKFSVSTTKKKGDDGAKTKRLTVKLGDKTIIDRSKKKEASKFGVRTSLKATSYGPASSEKVDKINRRRRNMPGDVYTFDSDNTNTFNSDNTKSVDVSSKRSKVKSSNINIGGLALGRYKEKYGKIKQERSTDIKSNSIGGGKSLPGVKIKEREVGYVNPKKGMKGQSSTSKKKGTIEIESSNYGIKFGRRFGNSGQLNYYPNARVIGKRGKRKQGTDETVKTKIRKTKVK